jgi:hypothetical protein
MVQNEVEQDNPGLQGGEVQEMVDWFVGFKEDFSMIYLMDCPQCDVLITYPGQGHHCSDEVNESDFKEWEAQHYAGIIQDLIAIYAVKDLEDVD